VLSGRGESLAGIVNGIDTAAWDPGNDPHLPRSYGEADVVEGKYAAKSALASRLGHVAPDPRPLIAFVGRLAEQKGIGLVFDLLERLAGSGRARFLVLGTGDPRAEDGLRRLAASYPGTIDLVIGFDEGLAHLVQAAADITIVPSLFEPCGLTQLYAQRYGSIPVVRATGGLVDTVIDTTPDTLRDGTATGFVFHGFEAAGLAQALDRAIQAHADKPLWSGLMRHVMRQDWSWETSGRDYLRLFERTRMASCAR
jgi:starch synthase